MSLFITSLLSRRQKPSDGESSEDVQSRQSFSQLISGIVESDWLNRVDNIVGFHAFYSAAQKQWRALDDGSGRVKLDAFVKAIRQSLAGLWSDKLQPIVVALHGKARDLLGVQGTGQVEGQAGEGEPSAASEQLDRKSSLLQFKALWQSRIVDLWQNKVASPATEIFTRSLNFYLDTKSKLSTPIDFVNGMRTQLGQMWDDNLEQPLREFYKGAKQATREDLLQLRAQIQAQLVSSKTNMTSKAKSIRSEISDKISGLIERIVRLINTILAVIYPSYRLPETQEKEEQEEQEQEHKEHAQPKKVKYSFANLKLTAIKYGRAVWSWSVAKAESIPVLSRVVSFGKNAYTKAEGIVKPRYDILIRTLAHIYANFQLKKRVSVAYTGTRSLIERSIQYVKKSTVRELIKDEYYFVLDLPKFIGQIIGFYPAHTAHFDVLATEINQLLTKVITLPEEGSDRDHDQDSNTSSQSPSQSPLESQPQPQD